MKYIEESKGLNLSQAREFVEQVRREIETRQFTRPDKLPFPPKERGLLYAGNKTTKA